MCLAFPGKIKKINGKTAVVEYPHETCEVLVGEKNLKAGDFVMVQMGIAIRKLTPKEAKESLAAWGQL
ncbi:MAG: HypC/HybG/HupF family hydrogenase formation chaperone [Patescibacteria group bacterium]